MEMELTLMDPEGEGFNPLEQEGSNKPIDVTTPEPEEFIISDNFEVKVAERKAAKAPGEEPDEEPETPETPAEAPEAKVTSTKKTEKPVSAAEPKGEEEGDIYTIVAQALNKWGVLENFDPEEFDGSIDSLKGLFEKSNETYHKAQMEKLEANLPPRLRKELGLAKESFVDEEISEAVERIEGLKSISEDTLSTNKELAKTLYKESLLARGFSEQKADRYVKIAEEENALVEEGLDAKEYLLNLDESFVKGKQDEIKSKQEAIRAARAKDQERLKSFIFESKEYVPGLPVTQKLKQAVYDSLTKSVGEGPDGKPINRVQKIAMSNGPGFQALLHYYTELGLFNQDKEGNFVPSLEKIQTVAKSTVVKDLDLESNLRGKLFKSSGQQNLHDEEGLSLLERIRRDKTNR